MNCLIICSYFDGESTGSLRARSWAKYLYDSGHNVTVYTTDANAVSIDGIYMEYIQHSLPLKKSYFLNKIYQYSRKALYCIGGIKWHLSFGKKINYKHMHYDLIWASSPQPELLDLALTINKYIGAKLICDFRDGLLFEPLKNHNFLEKYRYSKLERAVVNESQIITTVSDEIRDYFNYRYDVNHAVTITNGFDYNPTPNKEYEKLFSEKDINIVYTGSISKSRKCLKLSLLSLVESYDTLPKGVRDKLKFHFIGDYSKEECLILKDRFNVISKVSRQESIQRQLSADYLLLFTGDDKSVLTGKFFEYLSSQRPIIAITCGGSIDSIIEKTNSGYCFNYKEPNELRDFLFNVDKNIQLDNEVLLNEFSRDSLNEKLLGLIVND